MLFQKRPCDNQITPEFCDFAYLKALSIYAEINSNKDTDFKDPDVYDPFFNSDGARKHETLLQYHQETDKSPFKYDYDKSKINEIVYPPQNSVL
jgi:hypothetical protein